MMKKPETRIPLLTMGLFETYGTLPLRTASGFTAYSPRRTPGSSAKRRWKLVRRLRGGRR